MADQIVILTRRLSREKLAQFLGNNHELIKAFEQLTQDVSVTLPDAIEALLQQVDELADISANAFASSAALMALVALARQEAQADDLRAQVAQLRETVAALQRGVSQLHEGPTP